MGPDSTTSCSAATAPTGSTAARATTSSGGDQHPGSRNDTWQDDTLRGGAGNDWIYTSHGVNRVYAGPGNDIVRAYYGRGTIDCGSGYDTAQVRMNGAYRLVHCEHVVHFCAFGSKADGTCRKPGEARASGRRRTG